MKINLEIDNFEIISSGSIIVDQSKPMFFKFENNNINFKFIFTVDTEKETSRFETKIYEEENYLEFNIINSNSGQLLGNQDLIPLAKLGGKQLYLKFRVTSVGDEIKDMVFHYSWYLEN